MTDEIPQGFERHSRKSPVTEPWEPLYSRRQSGLVQLGLRLRDAHCNGRGFLHGGVIAALADSAMGWSYQAARVEAYGDKGGAVTASLSIDYLASAKPGQWLQVEPRIVKAGRSTGWVDAVVTADGELIARANATFRVPSG